LSYRAMASGTELTGILSM